MADVSAMIGLKVRIKMAAPLTDEHEGDLFAYDDKNGTVAIRECPSKQLCLAVMSLYWLSRCRVEPTPCLSQPY